MYKGKFVPALLVAAVFIFVKPAHAYLDPGTGMSFVSGFLGIVIGFFTLIAGAVAVTFRRWSAWVKKLFSKEK